MPRDYERRRSRSRERHRDRGENYDRLRKHGDRDEYRRRDRDYGHDYDDRDIDRERHRRDKERDRKRKHDHREERRRSRSRSATPVIYPTIAPEGEADKNEDIEPITEEEAEMMRTMGFCSFNSTKGKHVIGNSVYVANISKQRKYRQYMNRRGGFNRPLDPVA